MTPVPEEDIGNPLIMVEAGKPQTSDTYMGDIQLLIDEQIGRPKV